MKPLPVAALTGAREAHFFLEQLAGAYGPPVQEFCIRPEIAQDLAAAGGLELHIPAFAFRNFQGRYATGPVQLQLREAYNTMEMLLLGKSTLVHQSIQEAAGIFHLSAFDENGMLELAKPIRIAVPSKRDMFNPAALRLYYEAQAVTKAAFDEGDSGWKSADLCPVLHPLRLGENRYWGGELHELGWFAALSSLGKIRQTSMLSLRTVSSWPQPEAKAAYLILEGRQALVRMHNDGRKFSCFNIPSRESAVAVAFGVLEETFLWGIKPMPRIKNDNWFVELLPGAVAELKVNLEQICNSRQEAVWIK